MLTLKRAYEPYAESDGYRVLVDRLWPRGIRKDDAHLDAWPKALTPSDELRKWFHHDPEHWSEFRARYRRELRSPAAKTLIDDLAKRTRRGNVTLVYSAHDQVHNGAIVLRDLIERAGGVTSKPRRPARPRA